MQQSSHRKKNPERCLYYEILYETGAAQTDAANLTAEDIDWQNGVLVYRRKKLGPFSEPCRLTIGRRLREILKSLPESGDLFSSIKRTSANHRSAEFGRRPANRAFCQIACRSKNSGSKLSRYAISVAENSVRRANSSQTEFHSVHLPLTVFPLFGEAALEGNSFQARSHVHNFRRT